MADLLTEKRIDAGSIAATMNQALLEVSSLIREKRQVVPKIVEVAHGDTAFEVPQDYVLDVVGSANAVGIEHQIENVGTNPRDLSSRVAALSVDPSIHGILVTGFNLHHGEEIYRFNELAPAKDIECKTPWRRLQLLEQGLHRLDEPTAGAIQTLISYGLERKPTFQTNVALVVYPSEAEIMRALAAKNFASVARTDEPRADNIDLIRQADAVVTRMPLDREFVRKGQVLVTTSYAADRSHQAQGQLIDSLTFVKAFATAREISPLRRRVLHLNLLRTALDQLKIDTQSRAKFVSAFRPL